MKEVEESEETKIQREDLKVIINSLVVMEDNAQRNFLFTLADIGCWQTLDQSVWNFFFILFNFFTIFFTLKCFVHLIFDKWIFYF